MKKIIKRAFWSLLIIIAGLSIASFAKPAGGDVYEVFIGDKLLFRQFVHRDNSVKEITLSPADYTEKLNIRYSHCGVMGKQRAITLKDAQNKVLKQWKFSEARSANSIMSCNAGEIMDLQKSGNTVIRLYYSSAELPEGKCLVSLVNQGKAVSSNP